MPRRFLFVVAIVATLLAACGGTASQPALTDPKDILAHGVSSLQGLKTVHIKGTLSGKVDPGALSGTGSGVTMDLSGSTLEGDLDVADVEGHFTVAVPALLGFSAELVATGGNAYVKTSLSPDGKFHKVDTSSITSGLPLPSLPTAASPDASAVAAAIDQVKAALDKLTTPPTKLADEKIGDQDCYHVQFKISAADMPQASASLGSGSVTVDVWTRKSDYRPARITIAVDAGTQGNLTGTVDFTNYDAPVVVPAPPADQISDQPLSLPGILGQ
jgi:hypothetical protein